MTQISFIVTSCNAAPFVRHCLTSLSQVIRPGDQLIIVDDGSTDDTVDEIHRALKELTWPKDIEQCEVLFGKTTFGGVAIAANIGLSKATRETVFLLDARNGLIPDSFQHARSAFETAGCDVLLARCRVVDEIEDQHIWEELTKAADPGMAREIALRMNAQLGRAFYRRAFLESYEIQFPEGDFLSEEDPFHWQVCLSAERIEFCDVAVSYARDPHRQVDRARPETLFEHYETILAHVVRLAPALEPLADLWLLAQMTGHLRTMTPEAIFAYAGAAEAALCDARRDRWLADRLPDLAGTDMGYYLSALLKGGAHALTKAWMSAFTARHLAQVHSDMTQLRGQVNDLFGRQDSIERGLTEARQTAVAALNQAEFSALRTDNKSK